MNADTKHLTVHVFSFGFKYGGTPADESGNGGGFVFDCRALPNPFWDERLRPYSGRDAPVVAFMEAQPEARAYSEHATALVLQTARIYRELERERLMVSFGCTGGRHRSVYQAERLARRLEQEGIAVVLEHLHLHRDAAENERESDDSGGGERHPSAPAHR